MTTVSLSVRSIDLSEISQEAVVNHIALKVSHAFSERIAPHYVAVARARAPVSRAHSGEFNPRKFQLLSLRSESEFPGRSNEAFEARSRLRRLRGEGRGRTDIVSPSDIRFFKGRAGLNKGQTPDAIAIRRGTVVGAFQHKSGALKASIRFDGVRRSGNQVIATVRAHAPYALYRHEGFTHRGGSKHGGKGTYIKGSPFLRSPLSNIRERLVDPSTYSG